MKKQQWSDVIRAELDGLWIAYKDHAEKLQAKIGEIRAVVLSFSKVLEGSVPNGELRCGMTGEMLAQLEPLYIQLQEEHKIQIRCEMIIEITCSRALLR